MTEALQPPPLVPSEVDLRDFATMPLDVLMLRDSRFAGEVTGDAFRAGVMLWCAAWHQVPCGSLPDNEAELSKLAGYGFAVQQWKRVKKQAMQGFVQCSDGRWYHEEVSARALTAWRSRLEHYFERAKDRLRKLNGQRKDQGLPALPPLTFDQWNEARVAGGIPMERADAVAGIPPATPQQAGGIPPENALKGKGTEQRGNGKGEGEGTEYSLLDAAPPANPPAAAAAAAPPAAEPPPPARGTRLPKDWALPKPWGDWALAEYPQWTPAKVRTEGAKFADHWHAKAGKDAAKVDWLATWRSWCRSDIAHRDDPRPPVNGSAQHDLDELTAGVQRRLGITPSPQETIDG